MQLFFGNDPNVYPMEKVIIRLGIERTESNDQHNHMTRRALLSMEQTSHRAKIVRTWTPLRNWVCMPDANKAA